MGIIYTGERDEQLKELTAERAVAAVPLCGRYRLIDFPLSAMVDSGVRNVVVITQKNYHIWAAAVNGTCTASARAWLSCRPS